MQERKADHPIHPLILNRWSPRAMTGEKISEEIWQSLLEAARFAPSCYNEQPWRFIYAVSGTAAFDQFLATLVEFNQTWASKAGILCVVASRKTFEKTQKPSVTHAFDAGAAWENLALEGSNRGLVVHGMGGFDYAKARIATKIPEDFELLMMFAVGKRAPKESLPPDLQKKESPSDRKPISEFAFEGTFRK